MTRLNSVWTSSSNAGFGGRPIATPLRSISTAPCWAAQSIEATKAKKKPMERAKGEKKPAAPAVEVEAKVEAKPVKAKKSKAA